MNFQLRLILRPLRDLPRRKKPFAWLYVALAWPFYLVAALFLRARWRFWLAGTAKLKKEIYGRR